MPCRRLRCALPPPAPPPPPPQHEASTARARPTLAIHSCTRIQTVGNSNHGHRLCVDRRLHTTRQRVPPVPCCRISRSPHFTSTHHAAETTDVAALEAEFPGLLTPFAAFLEETGWGEADLTYDDLAAASVVSASAE